MSLKNTAIFLCVLLTLPVVLAAEDEKDCKNTLMLGVKGGVSFSSHWSTAEESDAYERETTGQDGFAGGVFASIPLGGIFALQPELLFVQKGADHRINISSVPVGDINVAYEVDYIEIPVLLKLYLLDFDGIRFYTSGGGYIAFMTGSSYSFTNKYIPGFTVDMEDLEDPDFGFTFGNGFEFKAENITLSVEYRYSMGFVDVVYPTGPGFPEIELRNLTHMIFVSIGLDL